MLLFPLTLMLGVTIGWLRGGSFRSLADIHMRLPGLLLVAVAMQLGINAVGSSGTGRLTALACSYGLLGLWLAANLASDSGWRRAGLATVAAGYILNLLAILANGSMPVSMAALREVGGTQAAFLQAPNVDKHIAAGSETAWLWLGDVVPVPLLRAVISVGDVAILVGVVLVICAGMVRMGASVSGPRAT
jgi:hypothetical protein